MPPAGNFPPGASSFPSYPSVPPRDPYPTLPSAAPMPAPAAPGSGQAVPNPSVAASERAGYTSPVPSILSLVFAGTVIFSWLAVLFGHIALAKSPKPSPYHVHALTGLILGYAGLILFILILSVLTVLKARSGA